MKQIYVTDEEKQIKINALSNITWCGKILVYSLAFIGLMLFLSELGWINDKSFGFVFITCWPCFLILIGIPRLIYEIATLFVHKKKLDALLLVVISSFFASYFFPGLLCGWLMTIFNRPLNFLSIDPIQLIFIVGTLIGLLITCIRLPKEAKRVDEDIQRERKEEEERQKKYALRLLEMEKEGKNLSPEDKIFLKQYKVGKQTKSTKRKKKSINSARNSHDWLSQIVSSIY